MTPTARPTSPTISTLINEVGRGTPGAVDAFWAEVARCGTPLVEETDRLGECLVTFLWRDVDGDTNNVVVVGGPARWEDLAEDTMERLAETDVWFRTYVVADDLVCGYHLSLNDSLIPPDEVEDWVERELTFRHDPLNSHSVAWPANPSDPSVPAHLRSVLALPAATEASLVARREGVPRGEVTEHLVASDLLGNARSVWVYRPPGVRDREPTALMVLFDGWIWSQPLPVSDLLDNLRADGRIPPLTVVMVDSMDDDTRVRELECHRPFLTFLVAELLPWVRARWSVTDDSEQVVVAGQSLGGLAGAYAALEEPTVFGAVISQSGSFWLERGEPSDTRTEWLTKEIGRRPHQDVRFQLSVGCFEGADMLPVNHRFRDALKAKGYSYDYREFTGGHDWVAWRVGLARDLTQTFRARMGARADVSPESSPP